MKKVLKCTCRTCGKGFEAYADYLIPGVEGHMSLAEGTIKILDPTRTNRMCNECVSAELDKLAAGEEEDR